jgi:energy-coupling factor transporter ATP-binding protein EcfA2
MRVHLSRILAFNWYGYRRIIELHGLSLITGANGSGKSALLDLLQFVMLGEQLSRFNKAAAGAGSGRTLRGYCLCDTNTLGKDGQERYLRPSGVTLAGLEFSWPGEAPRRETWGARIEYEGPTSRPRTVWFTVPCRMEGDDFLGSDLLPGSLSFLTEDEFRTHVKRDLGGEIFDRQGTYLEEMAARAHLAFDRTQMNKTLPNSMAFQPVESFEKFIREYLLEPGMPDVKAVRASVDAHRQAQARLEKMHDQHQRLVRVSGHHARYVSTRKEASIYRHLRDVLSHEEKIEQLDSRRIRINELRGENHENQFKHDEALAERNELEQQLNAVRLVAGNDSQITHLAQNRARHEEIAKEAEALREAAAAARQYLHEREQHWRQWLRLGTDLGLEEPEMAHDWLTKMGGNDEAAGLDAADKMPRIYQVLISEARDHLRPIEERLRELEAREQRLIRELEDLDAKGTSAPSPLLDALKSRGQRADALGRVIEVKPQAESWWPVLETLLAQEKNAILPENFDAAWNHALRLGHVAETIVNPAELAAISESTGGSVADFFETSHSLARNYLQHLYGNIMAVETSAALDDHPRALSLDGWLKDPPRRIFLEQSREFSIGSEGLRRLRVRREEELEEIREEIRDLRRQQEDWQTFLHRGTHWHLDRSDRPEGTARLHRLADLRSELQQLEETIRLLATPEREETVEKLQQLERKYKTAFERVVRFATHLEKFTAQEEELEALIQTAEEEELNARTQRMKSREAVEGSDADIQEMLEGAMSQFTKWSQRVEAATALAQQRLMDADKARRDRNLERQALAETHPDTADAFDPEDDANDRYDLRRQELESHELDKYKSAAEDARKEWEDRLQHQVLDVLKEKLEEAERTKREMNKAMDHEISGWRYQLTMRADRSHSAIWTLVDKGLNPGLELFAAGVKEEIENAKQALMLAIENSEDPRHQRALDYRYYHHWDIQATPVGKGEGAAISLNKSAKKQSGGENQAPFFVAMLAAFQRVYDLGLKEHRPNLGVVIMDEAFSKLSGDRIDACLKLAQNFGLQLVMAFPEDRLPTMIEHAETVLQCRVERDYDETSGNVLDIENWVVKVDRDKLAEAFA